MCPRGAQIYVWTLNEMRTGAEQVILVILPQSNSLYRLEIGIGRNSFFKKYAEMEQGEGR